MLTCKILPIAPRLEPKTQETYEWFWQQSLLFGRLIDYYTENLEQLETLKQVHPVWKEKLEQPDNHLLPVLSQLETDDTIELLQRGFCSVHHENFKIDVLMDRLEFQEPTRSKNTGILCSRLTIKDIPYNSQSTLVFKTPKMTGNFIKPKTHLNGQSNLNFWADLNQDDVKVKKWTEFCQKLTDKLSQIKDLWEGGKYRNYEVLPIVKNSNGNLSSNYPPCWIIKFDQQTEGYDEQKNKVSLSDNLKGVHVKLMALVAIRRVFIVENIKKVGFTIKVYQVRYWPEQTVLPTGTLLIDADEDT